MTDQELDPAKTAGLIPFNAVDYLNTNEDIAAYLEAIMEDDGKHPTDADVLRSAIRDAIAALRKMTP